MKNIWTILATIFISTYFWIEIEKQNLAVVKAVISCANTESFDESAYKICQKYAVKAGVFNELFD